jgi:hypothetical protein
MWMQHQTVISDAAEIQVVSDLATGDVISKTSYTDHFIFYVVGAYVETVTDDSSQCLEI